MGTRHTINRRTVLAIGAAGTSALALAGCGQSGETCAIPAGRQLHCPAHDALFNAATGEVEQGPAARALTKLAVSVVDGKVLSA